MLSIGTCPSVCPVRPAVTEMPPFLIPPPVTTMSSNPNFDGTIHLVRGGKTLCGILTSDDVVKLVATELGSLSTALRRSGERESTERTRLETP